VNGVFALSEMAVVSSRRTRLQSLADEDSAGAQVALRLMEHGTEAGVAPITVRAGA
jgi:putative hemolysin